MKHVILGAIMFAVFILQNVITSHIEILGIAPSLLLVLVVVYALFCESPWECIIYSAAGGALSDILWGRVFGLGFILMIYAGVAVYYAGEYFYKQTATKASILTFFATVVWEAAFYAASFTLFGESGFLYMLFRVIVPAGAYNAVIGLLGYMLIGAFLQRKKESESV